MTRSHQSPHSHGGYLSPISVVDCCLSLRYRSEDCAGGTRVGWPINEGISFSLNVCFLILDTDWSGSCWYCGVFFFNCFVWKGVGGEWWTLWCWQYSELLVCSAYVWESHCVAPVAAKNSQISLWGLIQICTPIFSTHNSIPEIWRLSTHKVSLDYLQYLGTCVISAQMERFLCFTCWLEIL